MTDINILIEDLPSDAPGKTIKMIKFIGQLDESNVDEKSKIIYAEIEKAPQKLFLILDLEGLEYMNSKACGFLTDWYGKITEGLGRIVIAKARPNILDILEVIGLTQLMNCYPSLEEAKLSVYEGQSIAQPNTPAVGQVLTETPAPNTVTPNNDNNQPTVLSV